MQDSNDMSISINLPGESTILATRSSPRPLRKRSRVVDAWARIWPPNGFRPSAPAKRALAPGSLCTWLVCMHIISIRCN